MSQTSSRPTLFTLLTTLSIVSALVMASCGVPTDDAARPVPNALERLERTGDPSEAATSEGAFPVTLYFVDSDDNLYAVERNFSDAPTVNDILDGLEANPEGLETLVSDSEIDGNAEPVPQLITSLLEEMRPHDGGFDPSLNQQIVSVSSDAKLRELEPGRLTRIFTQIVCTLTQEDFEISSVSIVEDDGTSLKPIFAQNASGAPNIDASEREDYACDEARVLSEPPTSSNARTKRAIEQEEL